MQRAEAETMEKNLRKLPQSGSAGNSGALPSRSNSQIQLAQPSHFTHGNRSGNAGTTNSPTSSIAGSGNASHGPAEKGVGSNRYGGGAGREHSIRGQPKDENKKGKQVARRGPQATTEWGEEGDWQRGERRGGQKDFQRLKYQLQRMHSSGPNSQSASWSAGHQWYHQQQWTQRHSKEQFLWATCQFVTRDDRLPILWWQKDADLQLDWDSVELIRVKSERNAAVRCPICLAEGPELLAARMGKCGHIFCWPCVLHYLALSDNNWRPCPICYESLRAKDLKSVHVENVDPVHVGGEVTLQLMVCGSKNDIRPRPLNRWKGLTQESVEEVDSTDSSIESAAESATAETFWKIRGWSTSKLDDMLGAEENELQAAAISEEDTPEVCFIENALQQLRERRMVLQSNETKSTVESASSSPVHEEGSHASFFYQATDGQHVYLHPFSVRMLVQDYGQLSEAPLTLQGEIFELEMHSMTHETRRRYRFLSHLPLGCIFTLVEIALSPPSLSEETLALFHGQIHDRIQSRHMRHQEDEKRQKKALNAFRKDIRGPRHGSLMGELQKNMRYGDEELRSVDLDFASDVNFPAVGTSGTSPPGRTGEVEREESFPGLPTAPKSFAQTLREGRSSAPAQLVAQRGSWEGLVEVKSEEDEGRSSVASSFSFAGMDQILGQMDSAPAEKERGAGRGKRGKAKFTRLVSGNALPRM